MGGGRRNYNEDVKQIKFKSYIIISTITEKQLAKFILYDKYSQKTE